jgi:hypothetical protein
MVLLARLSLAESPGDKEELDQRQQHGIIVFPGTHAC